MNCSYYLRLGVADKPGVLAEITAILTGQGISVLSFLQHSPEIGENVQLVLTTHETREASMLAAMKAIADLDFCT